MFRLYGRLGCAIATAFVFSGCAGLPLEQGRSNVQSLVHSRAPVSLEDASASRIATWLATPLTLEQAQQIALQRNPALKMSYARLGLTAADVFEAGRLQNPSLGLSWLLPTGAADGSKVGASLMASFADLLVRGSRKRIAAVEYQALQEQIASDTLDVLAATQRAWFDCVAANQRVAVRRSVAEAAQLGADLARQYNEAGNINALESRWLMRRWNWPIRGRSCRSCWGCPLRSPDGKFRNRCRKSRRTHLCPRKRLARVRSISGSTSRPPDGMCRP
jgi:outer membrane protein, heavy metal efflux system